MIKYKLQVRGVPITSIQYKGAPIGHLHYKGTPYSYWENPPPEPEPEPPAPPKPLTIYRLSGDSVGLTRVTLNVAATNWFDLQVGIRASGYNYLASHRLLSRGVWSDEERGAPAPMRAGEPESYTVGLGKGASTYESVPGSSSTTPPVTFPSLEGFVLRIDWEGHRGRPYLAFGLLHTVRGAYGNLQRLRYTASASFNENGECVSAQDSSYTSTQQGHGLTAAQRPTLTHSGSSFRVRGGAWVRLIKVSG